GQSVAARATPSETSRHPGHPLCHGRSRLRTLSAPGHRHRLPTHGDPRAPGQGQTRSLRDALPRPAPTPATLLEALSTPLVALSRSPHHRAHHPRRRGPYVHPSRPRRQAHESCVSSSITALSRAPSYAGVTSKTPATTCHTHFETRHNSRRYLRAISPSGEEAM